MPFISICIPAYERAAYLRRLLESICEQEFRDFELVVSDDSRSDAVRRLLDEYEARLPIRYVHNNPALGTPANWNAAMDLAGGRWIKVMHDDDWFARPDALRVMATAAETAAQPEFIWCGYDAVYESGRQVPMHQGLNPADVIRNPYRLFAKNVIGPPSNVLVRASATRYDARFKWLVDIDYYISAVRPGRAVFLPATLVHIGYNDSRVTESCLGNRAIEIPESLLLFQKHGYALCRGISLYNAWWRLIRNLEIRRLEDLAPHTQGLPVPRFLQRIIRAQSLIPASLLRVHVISFGLMTLHFLGTFHWAATGRDR